MCQSKANGGARCSGSPMGSALYSLYGHRRATDDAEWSETLTNRIEALKEASVVYGTRDLTPHAIDIPAPVEKVIDHLAVIGKPLVVGGVVRDSVLGAENKDIDIEVHSADMDDIVDHLKAEGYAVDEVGRQFGVLKVSKRGEVSDIDISVPRRESNVGAGHRSFTVEMDREMGVDEAAARRDFTFNAIMYDHRRGVIIDPTGGMKDLDNRVLRHVGPAFAEDPLRVLRAFQFAGRFSLDIHPETAELCKSLRPQYSTLSVERVQEEWGKFLLKSQRPLKGIKVLQDSGWDDTIPGLQDSLASEETQSALSRLPQQAGEKRAIMGAAAIARQVPADQRRAMLSHVLVGAKAQKTAETLAAFDGNTIQSDYDAKTQARNLVRPNLDFETIGEFGRMTGDQSLVRASEIANQAGVSQRPELQILTGNDLMDATGRKPGKWLGDVLGDVLDKQYRGEFESKEEAMAYGLTLIKD